MLTVYGHNNEIVLKRKCGEVIHLSAAVGVNNEYFLSFSDSTAISLLRKDNNVWKIQILHKGRSFITMEYDCPELAGSDRLIIGEDIAWTIGGTCFQNLRRP